MLTREMSSMSERSKLKRGVPWTAIVVVVCLFAAYVGAYVLNCETRSYGDEVAHVYPDGHFVYLYVPAAWVEAKVSRKRVALRTTAPGFCIYIQHFLAEP